MHGYVHYSALVLYLLSFLGDCTLNGMIILDVKSTSLQFSCQVKFNSGQTSYFYSDYCGLFIISNGYSPYLVVFFFISTIANDCKDGLKLKINVLSRSLIVFYFSIINIHILHIHVQLVLNVYHPQVYHL